MSYNRKIANATPCTVDGITFRSRSEGRFHAYLKERGLDHQYEPETFTLTGEYTPARAWYRDGRRQTAPLEAMTYTPDFRFTYGGRTVYLEVKGFQNDSYPLKRKLFLRLCDALGCTFVQARTVEQLERTLERMDRDEMKRTRRK